MFSFSIVYIINKSSKNHLKTLESLQDPPEESTVDIIEPTEAWKINVLEGAALSPFYVGREWVNYYRDLEGLPLMKKGQGYMNEMGTVWLYDMVKKYNKVEEEK